MGGASGDPDDRLPEDGADPEDFPDGRPGESAGDEDAIEKSLHTALSDLERMLQQHDGPEEDGAAARGRRHRAAEPDDDGEQYTIPLLDEVVVPGPALGRAAGHEDSEPAAEPEVFDADEPALRRRIAARLASEVEVIVQDRIEQALETAREEIRRRVRDHMDITLPEIVDDLVQARRRERGE